jgi:hypothetical protein
MRNATRQAVFVAVSSASYLDDMEHARSPCCLWSPKRELYEGVVLYRSYSTYAEDLADVSAGVIAR